MAKRETDTAVTYSEARYSHRKRQATVRVTQQLARLGLSGREKQKNVGVS